MRYDASATLSRVNLMFEGCENKRSFQSKCRYRVRQFVSFRNSYDTRSAIEYAENYKF